MQLFKSNSLSYGGELLKTRAGRRNGRPLDTKNSMHLVLRSSRAKGEFSFRRSRHRSSIKSIIKKFSRRYAIHIISIANVGNHIHIHFKLALRSTYRPFIRAVTGAIAMAVTGVSRWKASPLGKFWDYRPFTRVVVGASAALNLNNYIEVNQWEGLGACRFQARLLVATNNHRLE